MPTDAWIEDRDDDALASAPGVPRTVRDVSPRASRGPLTDDDGEAPVSRTRRAVTAEDFERIAMWAHRDVARVRCVEGYEGGVRLLIVPRGPSTSW